jgi:hypothetical protein
MFVKGVERRWVRWPADSLADPPVTTSRLSKLSCHSRPTIFKTFGYGTLRHRNTVVHSLSHFRLLMRIALGHIGQFNPRSRSRLWATISQCVQKGGNLTS